MISKFGITKKSTSPDCSDRIQAASAEVANWRILEPYRGGRTRTVMPLRATSDGILQAKSGLSINLKIAFFDAPYTTSNILLKRAIRIANKMN